MDYVTELRRYFHKYPELSGKEENTSSKIKEELEKLDIEYESVGDYGVIGILNGRSSGKTIALRADIDALPILESKDNNMSEKSVTSSIPNVCHACGHDGHSAMLLSSAKELCNMKDDFKGRVLFCFESGEEDGSGVEPMLKALEDKSIDGVWGIHLYSELKSGQMSVDEGPRMSGVHFFSVNVIGKGGHGSNPHQTIDPISCTVKILSNLSSILSREINPTKTCVLTIGKLNAGSAPNIIPETSSFEGTIRYFDREVSEKILSAFYRVVEGIAKAHNCTVEISMKQPGIPVINDSKLSLLAKKSITHSIGSESLTSSEPWMASESMGYYLEKYKGVFAFLGISDEEKGFGAAHHNPKFDFDDFVLRNGVKATVQFTLDFLANNVSSARYSAASSSASSGMGGGTSIGGGGGSFGGGSGGGTR